jgi:hypothetical protein
MENPIDSLKYHLSANQLDALHLEILNQNDRLSWDDNIRYLKSAVESLYQNHWLKVNHVLLSIFKLPELLGVDCDLFRQLISIKQPKDIDHASESLFNKLIQIAESQLREGGSTLFFNIGRMSSTRSVITISELVKARYRETIFVLNETDEMLKKLKKEWVDVSRFWRTSNGYRFLKARNIGTLIHVSEYREIRDCLIRELGCNPNDIAEECERMRSDDIQNYLQLSEPLDGFMTGLIASLGIRGKFDQYYKTWIDHEGLDEF